MNKIKRIISLFLATVLLFTISSSFVYAAPSDTVEYGSINYTYMNAEQKTGTIKARKQNDHIYCNADFIGALLGYEVKSNDNYICFQNIDATKTVCFSVGETDTVSISWPGELEYTAPFESIIEDSVAWVPLEFTLLLLNSDMLIAGDQLFISQPRKTVIQSFADVFKNRQKYSFDWQDDFGYSEGLKKYLGANSYLVTLLNGLLTFDGESILEFIVLFSGSTMVYDNKYSEDIAKLFACESTEELDAALEDVEKVNNILSPKGKVAEALDAGNKVLEENVIKQGEKFSKVIHSQNSSNIEFNVAFSQYKRAIKTQDNFLKNKKIVNEFQVAATNDTYHAFEILDKASKFIQYTSELKNQDEFSVNTLKWYCNNAMQGDYIPEQSVTTFQRVSNKLDSSLAEYNIGSYLEDSAPELFGEIIGDTVKEQLSGKLSLALALWDLGTIFIPFLHDGLDSEDSFILSTYAQLFQADAFACAINTSPNVALNEKELYTQVQIYYAYLKFCYIAREAALTTLEFQKNNLSNDQKLLQEFINYQEDINKEILEILAILKSAQVGKRGKVDNSNRAYGFLPSDNELYLKNYSDKELEKIIAENNSNESNEKPNYSQQDLSLYIPAVEKIISECGDTYNDEFNQGMLYDIDNDNFPELIIVNKIPANEGRFIWWEPRCSILDIENGKLETVTHIELQNSEFIGVAEYQNKKYYAESEMLSATADEDVSMGVYRVTLYDTTNLQPYLTLEYEKIVGNDTNYTNGILNNARCADGEIEPILNSVKYIDALCGQPKISAMTLKDLLEYLKSISKSENEEVTSEKNTSEESTTVLTTSQSDEITFDFDKATGTLTVRGSGKITQKDTYLGVDGDTIKKIIFDDRITAIEYFPSMLRNVVEIKLPANIKTIGYVGDLLVLSGPFEDYTSLKNIVFPEGLISIGENAFSGCTSLEKVVLPNSLKELGGCAFLNCQNLKGITLGSGLTHIPQSAFAQSGLEELMIPDNIVEIGISAFLKCNNLKKVTIGDGVTIIDHEAFKNCSSLSVVNLGKNIKDINSAFEGCVSLKSIVLPNSLAQIDDRTFFGCTALTSITIPSSVTLIKDSAFWNCNSLKDVYYGGSESQWNSIEMEYLNDSLINANIHYNCK